MSSPSLSLSLFFFESTQYGLWDFPHLKRSVIFIGLADAPPALRHLNSDASEDDVFMASFFLLSFIRVDECFLNFIFVDSKQTLDLPMERSDLQRSPMLNHHQQQQQQPPPPPSPAPPPNNAPLPPLPLEPHLHRIHFMQRRPLPPSSSTSSLPLLNNSITEGNATRPS